MMKPTALLLEVRASLQTHCNFIAVCGESRTCLAASGASEQESDGSEGEVEVPKTRKRGRPKNTAQPESDEAEADDELAPKWVTSRAGVSSRPSWTHPPTSLSPKLRLGPTDTRLKIFDRFVMPSNHPAKSV